jgi:hypothetical protein
MGSSFFGNVMHSITNPGSTVTHPFNPGAWRIAQTNNGTAGPYSGVAPSLAGANAGYGGQVQPDANSYARATPLNPYVRAAAGS